MIIIYDLQQSYTGRQMTAQQRQLSGTDQDGDNRGPWAVSIRPGRGGTLQHAQHSGPRLLRGTGAGERQLRSTELHSSSCCDSVGTSGDRQAMQWEAAFICLSPRGQEETPRPPSKAWALVRRKRSYQSPFLCCGGAAAQPACVAPASPRAICQPPAPGTSNLSDPTDRGDFKIGEHQQHLTTAEGNKTSC